MRLGAAVLQVLLGEPETSCGLDDGEIFTDVYLFLTKDGCIFLSRQLSGAVYFFTAVIFTCRSLSLFCYVVRAQRAL